MPSAKLLVSVVLCALGLVFRAASASSWTGSSWQDYPDSVVAEIPVGGDPTDIAVLPDGQFAYVANQEAQYVTVVNVETRSVVTRVSLGGNPYMVAARPDGQYVYATSEYGDDVSVIRTSDNTVVATVPVGDNPHRLCFSPDGSRFYTADEDDNTVTVVRTSDNTVVATVPVGKTPRDVNCTPDGQYVYTANKGDFTLTKIRTSDNTVVGNANVGFTTHRVRAKPGGEYVYATAYSGSRIAVVRVSDNTLVTTIDAGSAVCGTCFLNGGDYLYVASGYSGGAALVIRTSDNAIVARIATGAGPITVDTPADNAYVASANRVGQSVTVIGSRYQHDVCPVRILAPTGELDSGTSVIPRALVRNLGTSAELFPVTLRIGTGYTGTTEDTLPAGFSDTVSFPLWTASPVGRVPVICFTGLQGDEDPANDTIMDSVLVNQVVITDVGATAILAPSGTLDSGMLVTPAATVHNFGTASATFPVTMTIGGTYTQVLTESLPAGATGTVSFLPWTADSIGSFAVACHTTLRGDENPANDTARDSVLVNRVVITDVGATAILAPSGTLDSGMLVTPAATVHNFGTASAIFPVTMTIGGTYTQVLAESLPAGATDTVSFLPWTADSIGSFAVACRTALPGDENPANDTARDSVRVRRPPLVDAGVLSVLSPHGSVDSGGLCTPSAVVRNYGRTGAVFPVTMLIGVGYTQVISETLPSNTTDTVSFQSWNALQVGTFSVTCFTSLAGDEDPANDTITDSVHVLGPPRHDVGATAILAPTGTVHTGDTVIPRARISNFGNTAERFFDVRFRVGTSYNRTANVAQTLLPDSTVELTFAPWVAASGNWVVSCSTMLASDANRANDKVTSSVRALQQAVLHIEPDQSDRLEVGAGKTYQFDALIEADTGAVVELSRPSVPAGWSLRLNDATGTNELTDTDADGIPDLGYVAPGVQCWFSLEVLTPSGLVGDTASLSQRTFVLAGHLGSDSSVADTALLNLTLVPGFSVHNFPNPFSVRTAFVIGLPGDGTVSLSVYTRAGERICRVLDRETRAAGVHVVRWEAVNDHGHDVAPGAYEYVLDYVHQGETDRIRKKLVVTRE